MSPTPSSSAAIQGPYGAADRARWVAEDPARKRSDRDDFARDRARLIHSAGLRRLAGKTQVHSPAVDDFVRNRLTHSLEVAQIGRELGEALGCSADVVDTACLAHDLGHPPFGHNGERVLAQLLADVGGFEGNAQTLRLLTRLEAKRCHPDGRSAGLNLTRASLDATTKYPWGWGEHPRGGAKFGVYADDRAVFAWLRQCAPEDTPRRRCLEAQVMDWADDVAYAVHDVEDGVAQGLIDLRILASASDLAPVFSVARSWYGGEGAGQPSDDVLCAAADRLTSGGLVPAASYDGSRAALAALKDMTSRLVGRFVAGVLDATREQHGPGPLARYAADLVVPEPLRAECVLLKALAAHLVMLTPERERVMAREQEVVETLYAGLVERPQERLDPPYAADFAQADSDAGRRRVIADQIASLTDARATELATRWSRRGAADGAEAARSDVPRLAPHERGR